MKITSRPITPSDEADKSRDVPGFNKWARSSRTVGFIMFILGWFTIPIEVFLRRDFGQRWFTAVNFYAGFFLLLIFSGLQYMLSVLGEWFQALISDIATAINPLYTPPEEPTFTERILDKSMLFLLAAYLVIGSYHLFKIWWRNRSNMALHSFDDGTSRLEPLAGYVMNILNAVTIPIVYLYALMVPKKQKATLAIPKLVRNRSAFANTIVEPAFLFIVAYWTHGITSFWLFISAIALAIHANWKETAKLNKILDFRDSVIEAKVMMELKNETDQATTPIRQMMEQAATVIKDNPEVVPRLVNQYPDLISIIEEMNKDKSHLAN